ncbi:hypothetical protein, partial [Salmonella sp. s54395]|uniref:hypothetical protein n=1 Tax=Salmonella sp. s54395 TaxID=3159664 RepID=UPI00397FEB1A
LNHRSSKNFEAMNSCIVAPGTFHDELYEVSEPGSYLKWDFETKTANITFGIFLQPENGLKTPTEIVPLMKCECHMVPECGGITCKQAGKYVV